MGVEGFLELIWMVWKVWVGFEGLGWVRRTWDWDGGLRVVLKGQVIAWRPRMVKEGLIWV